MSRAWAVLLLLLTSSSLPAASRKPPRPVRAATAGSSDRLIRKLSLHDLIAQLMIIPCYGENPSSESKEFKDFAHLVRDTHVGGMIVLNRAVLGQIRNAEPYAMAVFLNRMQKLAQTPLLIGGDFERGASMRVAGTAKYPHNMAFTAAHDLSLTRYEGAATAREARALGVQWVFAPDADVNNNPDNPIINIRSYGEDPAAVSEQVRAYIEGAHSDPRYPVMLSAKHFPGHGDTATDSHLGMPSVTANRERLSAVELPPFQAAVKAGVDSIMTAHMSVPSLEPESIPATVSPKILTGLLRNELGFKGMIVTDAMDMQGLASKFPAGEAAVRALEAGADVLLMPLSPDQTIATIMKAVAQNRLSRARLETSARKILDAKAKLGLFRQKLVDLEQIADTIDSTEEARKAQEVADKSVTVLKNDESLLPLRAASAGCVFILTEGRYTQGGRIVLDELRKRRLSDNATVMDPVMKSVELEAVAQRAAQCGSIAVMAFTSASAYRNGAALPGEFSGFVETLLKGKVPVALFSLGNPYLLRSFPTVQAYATTYSPAPTAEVAAVKALVGEIPVQGRLPVSIPDIAKIGDGLRTPAVTGR